MAQNIVADKWGNSYVTSILSGIRIDKVNKMGQVCWSKTLSPYASQPKLNILPDGSIILAGKFIQTADLDPGPGVLNFTAANSNGDIFVERLDSAGALQWCRTYGGSSSGSLLQAITSDKIGNVIFISNTPPATDFDHGPGIVTTPNGGTSSICKLATNGTLVTLSAFPGNISTQSMSTDATNNILIAGKYIGTTDFDPGPGQYNVTPSSYQELFALKLNNNFGFKWAKTFISPNVNAQSNTVSAVQSDPSGNVYLTGETFDSFDADPGPGISNFTKVGAKDMFLVKLTSEGNFTFVKQFGLSRFTFPGAMCIDASGNVFISGLFDAPVDFDPGPAVVLLTPAYSFNAFAIKLSPNGRLLWAKAILSSSQLGNSVIAVDGDNQIHIAGTYSSGVNLGNNIFLTSAYITGVYLARFADANNLLGNVYYDSNANAVKELSEIGLGGVLLKAVSGQVEFYAISDSLGDYNIIADTGRYSIFVSPMPNYYNASMPDSQVAIFGGLLGQVDSLNNFGLVPELNKSDLRVHLTNITRARPGSSASYQIAYKNVGTTMLSGTLTLKHPANLLFVGSAPTAISQSDTINTWSFSGLLPMTTATVTVTYQLTANTAPGMVLKLISEGSVTNDQDTSNDVDTLLHVVTASFDPNDKSVKPAGNIFPDQVAAGHWLDYTVRFQNTGTDTAFNILLIDTLSSNLNLNSLEMIAASHPYKLQLKNNTLEWKFDNIYLPDSNTNELMSHGFVRYRIQIKKTLVQNDEVTNTAYIGFDYNEYVQTNTTTTKVIDSVISVCPGKTISLVMPNPGEGFSYQWQVDSTGNVFNDLTNNLGYSGVMNNTLNIINPTTLAYGFRYRCVATKGLNTVYSSINIIKFHANWTGTVSTSWGNAANWSCLLLPDPFTDVVIGKTANNPVINANTTCRSVKISSGASVVIQTGVGLIITNKTSQ